MYKPALSKTTEELAKKRRGEQVDVHQRLNDTKIEALDQTYRKPAGGDEDLRFKPAVCKKSQKLVRDQPVENVLTEDAKRRQAKKENNDKLYRESQKLSKE